MLNDFITLDSLFTFAGLVVVLGLIVQFTKGLIKRSFEDHVVRLYTFAWALVLMVLTYWFQGLFDVAGRDIAAAVLLVLLNSLLITIAAMGGYEVFADFKAEKKK